jgi:hypothetical protein
VVRPARGRASLSSHSSWLARAPVLPTHASERARSSIFGPVWPAMFEGRSRHMLFWEHVRYRENAVCVGTLIMPYASRQHTTTNSVILREESTGIVHAMRVCQSNGCLASNMACPWKWQKTESWDPASEETQCADNCNPMEVGQRSLFSSKLSTLGMQSYSVVIP